MRKLLAAAVGVVSAVGGTAVMAFAGGPPFNSDCDGVACRIERVPVKWQLIQVGRDLETLGLFYESGGCDLDNGRATVAETGSRIHISVAQDTVVAMDSPDGVFCNSDLRPQRLRVRLAGPVAGRKIRGGPRSTYRLPFLFQKNGDVVPRVLDLAATDAVDLLRSQGFKVGRGGQASGRVVAQTPRPGRPAKRGSVVKVLISRGPLPNPRRITLTSSGARVRAPIGNQCGRGPDALVGCTDAYFPGHPTRRSLPLRAGGLLGINTHRYAKQVVVRLTDGVREGGAVKGRLGPDLQAKRTDNSGRRWRVRLPDPLDPARGVSVVVSYADCAREFGYCAHYYARARQGRTANPGSRQSSGS